MKVKTTNRGFRRLEFTDYDGIKCHLQESSLATEPCIRFGCSELGLIYLAGDSTGWQPIKDLPKNTMGNTTMHLTQTQVWQVMPYLIEFAVFGTVGDLSNELQATLKATDIMKQVRTAYGRQEAE